MRKIKKVLNIIIALTLFLAVLGAPTVTAQAATPSDALKADPRLLQMAKENPDATFMVIVQKVVKNKDRKDMEVEGEIIKGGGQVKKQLDMIVSFSAEMTGKEISKLAKHPKVRWISADALVVSTATAGLESVLDSFGARIYNGDQGTSSWTGSWIEGNRYGDAKISTPDVGILRVDSGGPCSGASGYCLRIDPGEVGAYLYRKVNLNNVASATLSLHRNNRLGESFYDGEVKLEISSDGSTWSTLRTYSDREFTGSSVDTFDITAFASDKTRIRFYITDIQSGSRSIFFDDIQIAYARSSPFRSIVGADQLSFTGQGITVAVVDSGIADHVDLHNDPANNPLAASNPSRIIASDVFGEYPSPADQYEHGTHVAGIIAGNGAASGGKYTGMAPGVNLVNIRVSSDQGLTYISDAIEGLQWIYNNRELYNIRVVNLSITSTVAESYKTSPLDAALEILWFNGIVVVVAAGNNGTANGPSVIFPPANDPFVITVGGLEDRGTITLDDDFIGTFSAYGLTESGYAKPELVAPGRNLISLLAGTNITAYIEHPKYRVDNYYFRMSGTSMAAPVVSGAVALLLQNEPNLTPDQVKYRLMATASQNWSGYDPTKAGAGVVNALAAAINPTDMNANQGIQPSLILTTDNEGIAIDSVGWNTVGWNTVGWNTVGWNAVGWNTNIWDE